MLVGVISVTGCDLLEVEDDDLVETEAEEAAVLDDASYLSETYGFTMDIPEGYRIWEKSEDNVRFGSDDQGQMGYGFYVMLVEDLEARMSDRKNEGSVIEVVEETADTLTVTVNNGLQFTSYFIETSVGTVEVRYSEVDESVKTAVMETLSVN